MKEASAPELLFEVGHVRVVATGLGGQHLVVEEKAKGTLPGEYSWVRIGEVNQVSATGPAEKALLALIDVLRQA